MGCLALLWGILLTQGLNPGLLHCMQILSRLSHQGCLLLTINKHESLPLSVGWEEGLFDSMLIYLVLLDCLIHGLRISSQPWWPICWISKGDKIGIWLPILWVLSVCGRELSKMYTINCDVKLFHFRRVPFEDLWFYNVEWIETVSKLSFYYFE